jgi:hypothetical protein
MIVVRSSVVVVLTTFFDVAFVDPLKGLTAVVLYKVKLI